MRRGAVGALSLALALAACGGNVSVEPGAGSGASGAGGGCACGPLEQCWGDGLCVAKGVGMPGGYAIDATEVTRSQYAAWLATGPSLDGQGGACSWNGSLAPDAACMQGPAVCKGPACGGHPQPCVDACDAAAYCRGVGKRLCGAIGGGTALNPDDPAQSQWQNACTSGGANDFVYGNGPAAGSCNDYLAMQTTTVPAGSLAACESPVAPYAGVFDLIGNLAEWEDNCSTEAGASDICQPRGLSFGLGAAMPMCDSDDYAQRAEARGTLGFRCCAP